MLHHIVSVHQFLDTKRLDVIFKTADAFKQMKPADYPRVLQNKLVATLFYEPSTRTRLSFETAVQRLAARSSPQKMPASFLRLLRANR